MSLIRSFLTFSNYIRCWLLAIYIFACVCRRRKKIIIFACLYDLESYILNCEFL